MNKNILDNKTVNFAPQCTAIKTRKSTSAVRLSEELNNNNTLKVLDYGFGKGRNTFFIHSQLNKALSHGITCIDIQEQIEASQEEVQELRNLGCTVGTSEILESNSIDRAICCHVLNVIESDEVKKIVVADIYRALKKGGLATFEVRTKADVESSKTKKPYGKGWEIKKGKVLTYQEAISKEDMVDLMQGVGFEIIEHKFNKSSHLITLKK